MANLKKTLTKIPHLIVFEAVSRNPNFTRAAEELNVTRVSVSRQIAELESAVGAKLFHRNHRTVTMTLAGRALESEVSPALYQIAEALRRVAETASKTRLTVTMTAAFATYWLMPRLVDFNNQYPDIELNLVVSDRHLDLEAEGVDIAIRFAEKAPTIGRVTNLMQERIYPIVSPEYAANTKLERPEDLFNEQLLHLSGIYHPATRWPNWFRANGLELPSESAGVVVNTYINMLQAAIAGHGIALAGHPLVDSYLENGTLIKLDGFLEIERNYYYLVDTTNRREDANCFCEWLLKNI